MTETACSPPKKDAQYFANCNQLMDTLKFAKSAIVNNEERLVTCHHPGICFGNCPINTNQTGPPCVGLYLHRLRYGHEKHSRPEVFLMLIEAMTELKDEMKKWKLEHARETKLQDKNR